MSTAVKRGLGRGISALISEDFTGEPVANAPAVTVQEIELTYIQAGRFQPRRHFSEQELQELSDSIRKNGVIQPIILRALPGAQERYEIIAGERRFRAAGLAGLNTIPALVRILDDSQALEVAILENVQRLDLSPLEEAGGYQVLIDQFGYTQEQLSQAIGKSRSHIANLLRLLNLPESVKDLINTGKLSMGHARTLVTSDNPEALAQEILRRGLNVRQTEQYVKKGENNSEGEFQAASRLKTTRMTVSVSAHKDPDILALEETLSESLGLKVSINDRGQHGEIMIAYSSLEQLDEILRRLGENI